MMLSRPIACAALVAALLGGCGGDDDGGEPAIDATPPIPCTIGDDSPCAALDPAGYCWEFGTGGGGGGTAQVVCTKSCSTAGECPSGWSCNTMGRCRPPN